MPTNTLPTFQANTGIEGEPAFVVSYPHEGTTYVVGFDSFMDLLHVVTSYQDEYDRPLDGALINLIVDFAEESLEWNATPPVAEAVCDCEPLYDRHREAVIIARTVCEFWKSLFSWSLLANGVLLCLVLWRAGR
jgi:hypothetical protein